jgi:hypothetical protein
LFSGREPEEEEYVPETREELKDLMEEMNDPVFWQNVENEIIEKSIKGQSQDWSLRILMNTKQKISFINDLQRRLEEELEKLKNLLKMGYELRMVWLPNNGSELSGEVKGETIFIYEEALETLKHEFLEYAISKVIEPYRRIANQLIMLLNEELIEKLSKMI